jgi:L-ascorbate metabolism protein UlaG (beta-lactamase superfamily)
MTSRRALLGSAGLAAAGGAALAAYRVSPSFWRQFSRDLGRPVEAASRRPDFSRWSGRGIHAAWLGHSTVLLQIDGFTILTDPIFSTRAGIDLGVFTLGVKRLVEPAAAVAALPRIDLILVSHAHMDHLDTPSLKALESRRTSMLMAPATTDLVRAGRYASVREIRWNESAQVGPARVRAIEVNHWGARMRTDTYRGYNGYSIECGRWRVLFAGDTADTHVFQELRTARGFDLVVMPIGAYNPWIRYHCTPEQAWRMGNEAGAEMFLPVHHQTFALGREPFLEPITRLVDAAGSRPERVAWHRIGDEIRLT